MLERIGEGVAVLKVCKEEGLAPATFWHWLHIMPELAQEYDRAKAAQLEMMMDALIEHAEDLPDLPDPAQVAAKRLSVDTDYASLIQARIERLRDE